ncbi:predicted protein [Aspergillus terreus NIH2624]|uniref:Life-span regulatory factor n=2 Tax=Aspergillus terreus TaxID=33178 RepID=A0A5M3Z9X4_ASPTE|nr:uncharacterized protein ATEG_08498 [Aspergillus terreus NIH2624]EAU30630.1 predicted protein [Aspergillus terreus NIH2624]KAG2414160.1 hypothetical protein HFD88_003351 [Aspergillus terreus]GES65106.1 hypothetical protein ATETN484_0012001100 [Aspergillus terreus]GFF19238.1 Life-span regulatory factor [Aspergillus terreus]
MATDWSLDFCLVCDRQTLGAPYCSQSCRLAELDFSSDASLSAGRNAPAETVRSTRSPEPVARDDQARARVLSPSSSQTSLSSMKSHSSQASAAALVDQFQNELRDYANCFDPVRDLKRRLTA